MLQAILREAQQGGVLEVNRLAAHLQVSTELAQAMLDHLQRIGLLCELPCSAACPGCSLRAACSQRARLYRLSPQQV